MPIPTVIPGEVATRIIEDRVKYYVDMLPQMYDRLLPDGIFPGMKPISAKERRAKYSQLIAIEDVPIMTNENWLEEFARGLHPMPKSPYLQNLAQNSQQFLNVQRDFRNLFNSTAAFQ
jgi:hypothetical protein